MTWNHWLRIEVVWPLETLIWFCFSYSMRSHIHAWNMAWGCLTEWKIWFSPVYGRVVHVSPWLGCCFHMLIRGIFYGDLWSYVFIKMVTLWLSFHDLNVVYCWFICWLIAGNMLVIWCILAMVVDIVWFFDEWLMNAYDNRCYCTYYERELYILDDSKISIRPLCLNIESWPVDYMFAMCLMTWLSWLGLFRSSIWSSIV